jgi:hypothetical protein
MGDLVPFTSRLHMQDLRNKALREDLRDTHARYEKALAAAEAAVNLTQPPGIKGRTDTTSVLATDRRGKVTDSRIDCYKCGHCPDWHPVALQSAYELRHRGQRLILTGEKPGAWTQAPAGVQEDSLAPVAGSGWKPGQPLTHDTRVAWDEKRYHHLLREFVRTGDLGVKEEMLGHVTPAADLVQVDVDAYLGSAARWVPEPAVMDCGPGAKPEVVPESRKRLLHHRDGSLDWWSVTALGMLALYQLWIIVHMILGVF